MVGIMGGTFDPIHFGHLRLAEHIREEFSLSSIVFIPAGAPPHKAGSGILPAHHRLAMTRLAVADNPHFQISELECHKSGYSYTVETLDELAASGIGQMMLLLGADSVVQMSQWYQPGGILARAAVVAAPRPDTDLVRLHKAMEELKAKYGGDIRVSGAVAMPHASTEIRQMAAEGRSLRYLVPESVRAYIAEHDLYGANREDTQ